MFLIRLNKLKLYIMVDDRNLVVKIHDETDGSS